MSNKNDLIQNLNRLAEQERILWKAFRDAEKDSSVGLFNFRRQFKISRVIWSRSSRLARLHPYFLVIAIVSAFGATFGHDAWRGVAWIAYIATTFLAMFTRDRFLEDYAKSEVGVLVTRSAFGIDHVSLRIHKFFELKSRSGLPSLSDKQVDKIAKLVKSSQEYEATTFGYGDYLQKTTIAGLFALPFTVLPFWTTYHGQVEVYWGRLSAQIRQTPLAGAMLLLMAASIMLFLYAVLYGDKAASKQKKRYLLFLTMIKESYIV